MKVYLVRHGVTNEAEDNRRQFPHSSLSEAGIEQARAAGKRLLKEDVDLIFSSEWARAKQTAEIIGAEVNIPIEVFPGIHEKETNPILHGIKMNDPIHVSHDEQLKEDWGNLDWKFRGEGESIREVTVRAAKFRDDLIKTYLDKSVLVVTHSAYIKSFICSCILGDDYSDLDLLKLWLGMHIRNTGITLLEYNETEGTWVIEYLNDHFHLNP
jgi:broad specificity phosphatase PhoE